MPVQSLSCIRLFATLWTISHQAPLSIEFSKQEHWSKLPFPPPGDLPKPETKLESLVSHVLQVDSLPLSYQGSTIPCKLIPYDKSWLLKNVFVYFWLHWVFVGVWELSLAAVSRGYCLVMVHKRLIVGASLVAEHGL